MILRFAAAADEPRIVQFLRENWTPNSILVTSPLVFEYQYMRQAECGFVLAEDEETGAIQGIKGFIPLNHEPVPDVAAALAIALKGSHPMLNMEMQRYLEKNTNCRMMCSPGLNPNTAARVYPLFRYKVDKLKQYYRLGKKESFQIAHIAHVPPECGKEGGLRLVRYATLQEMLAHFTPEDYKANRPYKDAGYIEYRYFDHPVYEYQVYGAQAADGHASSLLVTREIACGGSRVIRIIDLIGRREDFAEIGGALDRLLADIGAEYIDFYCYGLPDAYLRDAGMTLREEQDENIIPNYFEPFVQKNVDIIFFCNLHEDFLICKSDGDQDRPSILPESFKKEV